jgi:DNA-binding transcriptional ArsR family regulator
MKKALAILRGLSDSTRLRIIQMLMRGPHCVEEMTTELRMSQPRVSRHLRILRDSGLVIPRRDRRRVYYSLAGPDDPDVAGILDFLETWLAPAGVRTGRASTAPPPDGRRSPAVEEIEDYLL